MVNFLTTMTPHKQPPANNDDIYSFRLEGLMVTTGDLICTTDGGGDLLVGEFWRILGRLVPGPIDHVVVYVGPGGRCVEAGARGVISFEVQGQSWDAAAMIQQRGPFVDTFYGIIYPLRKLGLSFEREKSIRLQIREYCLKQVRLKKPYNINFLNPESEKAFYCTQLAYKAYQPHGINLNTGMGVTNLKGSDRIVLPQEIWAGFPHAQPAQG